MADDEEKTEEPTSKKIEDAKKEGNVGKSTEVVGAAVLLFGSVYILFFSTFSLMEIKKLMLYSYSFIGEEMNDNVYYTIVYSVGITLLKSLAPLFILVFILVLLL